MTSVNCHSRTQTEAEEEEEEGRGERWHGDIPLGELFTPRETSQQHCTCSNDMTAAEGRGARRGGHGGATLTIRVRERSRSFRRTGFFLRLSAQNGSQ